MNHHAVVTKILVLLGQAVGWHLLTLICKYIFRYPLLYEINLLISAVPRKGSFFLLLLVIQLYLNGKKDLKPYDVVRTSRTISFQNSEISET